MVPGKCWGLMPSWRFVASIPVEPPPPLSRYGLEKPLCAWVGGEVGGWEDDSMKRPASESLGWVWRVVLEGRNPG